MRGTTCATVAPFPGGWDAIVPFAIVRRATSVTITSASSRSDRRRGQYSFSGLLVSFVLSQGGSDSGQQAHPPQVLTFQLVESHCTGDEAPRLLSLQRALAVASLFYPSSPRELIVNTDECGHMRWSAHQDGIIGTSRCSSTAWMASGQQPSVLHAAAMLDANICVGETTSGHADEMMPSERKAQLIIMRTVKGSTVDTLISHDVIEAVLCGLQQDGTSATDGGGGGSFAPCDWRKTLFQGPGIAAVLLPAIDRAILRNLVIVINSDEALAESALARGSISALVKDAFCRLAANHMDVFGRALRATKDSHRVVLVQAIADAVAGMWELASRRHRQMRDDAEPSATPQRCPFEASLLHLLCPEVAAAEMGTTFELSASRLRYMLEEALYKV